MIIIIIFGRRARAKFCETLGTYFFLVFKYVSYRMIWRLRLGLLGCVPPLPSPPPPGVMMSDLSEI